MKMMIMSDIHGSVACIEKMWERFNEDKPDRIILLGDLLYHGPRNALPSEYDTEKAAKLLNQHSDIITSVRGNCDSEVDQMLLDFIIESPHMILSDSGLNIFITHGHFYNTMNLPPMSNIDILMHGHTHIPAFEKIADNKYYINPGSISIPKGNSENSYILYENKKFTWKTIYGEIYKEETV